MKILKVEKVGNREFIKKELKAYLIGCECECGGELQSTGSWVSFECDMFYKHKCNRCSVEIDLSEEYPKRVIKGE